MLDPSENGVCHFLRLCPDLVGKPLYINVDQIASVSPPGNQTVVVVPAPGRDGALAYAVDEPWSVRRGRFREGVQPTAQPPCRSMGGRHRDFTSNP